MQKSAYMIEQGYLEKLEDFEHNGKTVLASRLGYRMTERFVHDHFGKIFDRPMAVLDEAMLKPETQGMAEFIDGINNICEAQQHVAEGYFLDGSVDDACPPLKALLHIMAYGEYEGMSVEDPAIRRMFTRAYLLESDWYKQRLEIKQARDKQLWLQHRDYLEKQIQQLDDDEEGRQQRLAERIIETDRLIDVVSDSDYLERLYGTLGADWISHSA
jgi:hypothetical protein